MQGIGKERDFRIWLWIIKQQGAKGDADIVASLVWSSKSSILEKTEHYFGARRS